MKKFAVGVIEMAKKGRTKMKPFTEGHLKELWDLFFLPIIKLRPKFISPKDWLSNIFCERTRNIYKCQAVRTFEFSGKLLVAPNIPVVGLGYKKVKKDTIVWIRHDITMPNRYDLEMQGKGRDAEVFHLTEEEWHSVRDNLVKLEC